jgi:outer membrane protein
MLANNAFAQKFGFIDAKFVMTQMEEYKQAEKEIDQLSQQWQKEITEMYAEIDKMKRAFRLEEVLMTKEMKEDRMAEIKKKEDEAKKYQNKVFGYEGLLFLKRQELIKPVQDKIYEAVEKVSKVKKIQIMFDKSAGLVMIYMSPQHDYTDFVLIELGLKEPVEEQE